MKIAASSQELVVLSSGCNEPAMNPHVFGNLGTGCRGFVETISGCSQLWRRRISEKAARKIDLLTAGFPCQDLSQAGKLPASGEIVPAW